MKVPPIPSFPFRVIEMNADKSIGLLTTDGFGTHYIWMNGRANEISDYEVRKDRKKALALFNKLCADHEIEEMKRTGTILAG